MTAHLEKLSLLLNRSLMAIAGVILVGMMTIACANVIMRSFGFPLKGTFELMGFFGSIIAAFALGKTQISQEHIAVDVLIRMFPQKLKLVAGSINCLIGIMFFVVAGWQTARWGINLQDVGEVSETLRIIYYPFVYCVSLGCMIIALVFLVDMLKLATSQKRTDL
ncbi:MAG TPA: TRAP transporter small permease [Deltaproteobacteria bacterium]|nr:TRAP transporter small permease [Deltaproteobacteria bacterium]HPR51281.1 TRAP transporter small permease [Deltaproteobacteria bacterium]